MPAVNEARVAARTADGVIQGYLRIALLPKQERSLAAPLMDLGDEARDSDSLPPIQLLEGYEYRYEWEALPDTISPVSTDPEEAFQPDSIDGLKGRLRPGLATGTLQVQLRSGGGASLGQLELEVRSRKLHYLSEYRWMLRDIADQMTELVMDRFAVSGTTFTLEGTRDAVTLYQRFAFLRALLTSEAFQLALSEITRRPHIAWEERIEIVRAGQPIRASAHTVKQLSRPGARQPWPDGPIVSIPVSLERKRTEATHDTTPNRFVRFALSHWRQVIADIDSGLAAAATNSAVVRGRREVAKTLEDLDSALHHDLFKDLGPLTRFPADDQVLQRREGYRDVFRAYLEFELAAKLSWRGADSSYTAGQRDVATLYEYWAFLQLSKLVASLVGQTFDLKSLIETRSDGLNVLLQTGKETVLSGIVVRHGRKMAIELCFNRTFSPGTATVGSWTRPMRPDYSLIITAPPDEPALFEPLVLHFDAKYRVNFISELFGQRDDFANKDSPTEPMEEVKRNGVLRADLLKMHAYRDAIHRSAGAYVLFPGEDEISSRAQYSEYQELLPGLGAFVLRPSQDGEASGIGTLRTFLDQVLDHVSTRLTQHERGRYWLEEVYGQPLPVATPSENALDTAPPPEATVLLGYVKSQEHWNWIWRCKTYNVRAIGRPGGIAASADLLYSQLLTLYCPEIGAIALTRIVSSPERVSEVAMKSASYPEPHGDYFCVHLSRIYGPPWLAKLTAEKIDFYIQSQGLLEGEPAAIPWATLQKISTS